MATMSLALDINNKNGQCTIKIKGILDISTVEIFHEEFEKCGSFNRLVIDFSEMRFVDSTGIGTIMQVIYASQDRGYTVKFNGLKEKAREVFETVGLFEIMKAMQDRGR